MPELSEFPPPVRNAVLMYEAAVGELVEMQRNVERLEETVASRRSGMLQKMHEHYTTQPLPPTIQHTVAAVEEAALGAVEYVGMHNGRERESEARSRVRTAFKALRQALGVPDA